MTTNNEVLRLISILSISDRLKIVEYILRGIREEREFGGEGSKSEEEIGPAILSMAGIIDEEEANVFDSAISESRKIDEDGW